MITLDAKVAQHRKIYTKISKRRVWIVLGGKYVATSLMYVYIWCTHRYRDVALKACLRVYQLGAIHKYLFVSHNIKNLCKIFSPNHIHQWVLGALYGGYSHIFVICHWILDIHIFDIDACKTRIFCWQQNITQYLRFLRYDVVVLSNPGTLRRLAPTIIRTRLGSAFCGR